MTSGGARGRPEAQPETFLERARQCPDSPRGRLDALLCCDLARWLAWPHDSDAAQALADQLLDCPTTGDDAATPVLAASVAARRALRAGDWDAGAARLAELPAGYPVKSTWLHWRDLLLATGRLDQWQAVRRRLATALQQTGLPASEVPTAVLGRLDLARWRAETRLLQQALPALTARHDEARGADQRGPARLVMLAAVGHYQLALGDEAGGAQLIHLAADEPSTTQPPEPARLFSRPTPEAAIWLRRAIERAAILDDDCRDGIRHHAVGAFFTLALRHRLRHVLHELATPAATRFQRPDLRAVALTGGALAWLACGEKWLAFDWLSEGLRLLLRHPRGPFSGEAAQHLVRWIEWTGELAQLDLLRDLAPRFGGSGELVAECEVARFGPRFGDRDQGWALLTAAYRKIPEHHPDAQPTLLIAVANALLDWRHDAVGYDLLRTALAWEPAASPRHLPRDLASGGGGAAEEAALAAHLSTAAVRLESAAAATRVLLARGRLRLAGLAHQAADRAIGRLAEPLPRLRAAVALARQVCDGLDLDLHAEVEAQVADEAAAVLERLRIDDPPPASRRT